MRPRGSGETSKSKVGSIKMRSEKNTFPNGFPGLTGEDVNIRNSLRIRGSGHNKVYSRKRLDSALQYAMSGIVNEFILWKWKGRSSRNFRATEKP